MSKSYSLNDDIILRLKKRIRSEASPRHVPSKIIQVSDIPRTKNGKIVELAVKNTIEGSKKYPIFSESKGFKWEKKI